MQYLRVFVKDLPDAVATVFADDRVAVLFHVLLDGCAYVAEVLAGREFLNA